MVAPAAARGFAPLDRAGCAAGGRLRAGVRGCRLVRVGRHAAAHRPAAAQRRRGHPLAGEPVAAAARGRAIRAGERQGSFRHQRGGHGGARARARARGRRPASGEPAVRYGNPRRASPGCGAISTRWRARTANSAPGSPIRQRAILAGTSTSPAVADPDDGDELRARRFARHRAVGQLADLSANTLDRWWGPAHEGSLILSNNARPMPTRHGRARRRRAPSRSSWLSWLGPWRMSASASARWKTSARTSTRRCSWPGASWSCRSRTSSSASRAPRSSAASSSSAIWRRLLEHARRQ